MQHIQGIARSQISFGSLEDRIPVDNPVLFLGWDCGYIGMVKILRCVQFVNSGD